MAQKVERVLGDKAYADAFTRIARERARRHSWSNRAGIILKNIFQETH